MRYAQRKQNSLRDKRLALCSQEPFDCMCKLNSLMDRRLAICPSEFVDKQLHSSLLRCVLTIIGNDHMALCFMPQSDVYSALLRAVAQNGGESTSIESSTGGVLRCVGISSQLHYIAFRAAGIQYGPTFRSVRQPWTCGSFSYAVFRLSSEIESWELQSKTLPPILDGALQQPPLLVSARQQPRPLPALHMAIVVEGANVSLFDRFQTRRVAPPQATPARHGRKRVLYAVRARSYTSGGHRPLLLHSPCWIRKSSQYIKD
jgi:hypothetical protein